MNGAKLNSTNQLSEDGASVMGVLSALEAKHFLMDAAHAALTLGGHPNARAARAMFRAPSVLFHLIYRWCVSTDMAGPLCATCQFRETGIYSLCGIPKAEHFSVWMFPRPDCCQPASSQHPGQPLTLLIDITEAAFLVGKGSPGQIITAPVVLYDAMEFFRRETRRGGQIELECVRSGPETSVWKLTPRLASRPLFVESDQIENVMVYTFDKRAGRHMVADGASDRSSQSPTPQGNAAIPTVERFDRYGMTDGGGLWHVYDGLTGKIMESFIDPRPAATCRDQRNSMPEGFAPKIQPLESGTTPNEA